MVVLPSLCYDVYFVGYLAYRGSSESYSFFMIHNGLIQSLIPNHPEQELFSKVRNSLLLLLLYIRFWTFFMFA